MNVLKGCHVLDQNLANSYGIYLEFKIKHFNIRLGIQGSNAYEIIPDFSVLDRTVSDNNENSSRIVL